MKLLIPLLFALLITACSSTPAGPRYQQAYDVHVEDYKTFAIEKIDVKGLNPEAMLKVGKAIKHALEARGLTYQKDNAELLIEYGVGIKHVQEVKLKVIPIGGNTYTDHTLEDSNYGTLLISASDTEKSKHVWYMSGSRKIENMDRSQDEVNEDFVGLFSNFK